MPFGWVGIMGNERMEMLMLMYFYYAFIYVEYSFIRPLTALPDALAQSLSSWAEWEK